MDTKPVLACRKKINELAIQHNKLTTLTACLLNEIISLKREVLELRSGNGESRNNNNQVPSSNNSSANTSSSNPKFANFNELRAEDILKQLSINNIEN